MVDKLIFFTECSSKVYVIIWSILHEVPCFLVFVCLYDVLSTFFYVHIIAFCFTLCYQFCFHNLPLWNIQFMGTKRVVHKASIKQLWRKNIQASHKVDLQFLRKVVNLICSFPKTTHNSMKLCFVLWIKSLAN